MGQISWGSWLAFAPAAAAGGAPAERPHDFIGAESIPRS